MVASESIVITFDEVDVCYGALRLTRDGGASISGAASAMSNLVIDGVSDVLGECERLRRSTPVMAGAVTAAHQVEDMPISKFSTASVIGVPGGGTGTRAFDIRAPVLGSGSGALRSAPPALRLLTDNALEVPAIRVKGGTILPGTDPFGRETLVIEHSAAGAPRVDLLNPLLSEVPTLYGSFCYRSEKRVGARLSAIFPSDFVGAVYPATATPSSAEILGGFGALEHASSEMAASNNPAGEPWPVLLDYLPSVILPRLPLEDGSEVIALAALTSGGLETSMIIPPPFPWID